MCNNSLLSSDSLSLQRLFISGLHCKDRHNMGKIFGMESMDCGMEKIRKPCWGFRIYRVLYVSVLLYVADLFLVVQQFADSTIEM